MITFCCLVIVAVLIYYYMHRDKQPQQQPQESEASAPTAPDKPKENTAIVFAQEILNNTKPLTEFTLQTYNLFGGLKR